MWGDPDYFIICVSVSLVWTMSGRGIAPFIIDVRVKAFFVQSVYKSKYFQMLYRVSVVAMFCMLTLMILIVLVCFAIVVLHWLFKA